MTRGLSDYERWVRQQEREQARLEREQAAAARAAERERKQQHIASSKHQAELSTWRLDKQVRELRTILREGLKRSSRIDFRSLRRTDPLPPVDLGAYANPWPEPTWEMFRPYEPGFLEGLFGRKRYEEKLARAKGLFYAAQQKHEVDERQRLEWIRRLEETHVQKIQDHQAEVESHNALVDSWHEGWKSRERESVERYLTEVTKHIPLPEGLPNVAEIAYSPRGEQVVARVELPGTDVVPTEAGYTYVASQDAQRATARPKAQITQLYRSVVSQVALLYLRDLFESDPALQVVDVNGHVHTTNRATGHAEYPCLISVTVERPAFDMLNLEEVTPENCLRHLNALVSGHPYEVEPVTPIREFDLTKFAFVDGLDAVSRLDSRPDLMEMTPTEFEHFVKQLFASMDGLEGWTTERTGDDGIDAVVTNRNSVVGGLTVVQVKQYTRVLGLSHIRELVGAMDEKRAGRGILVTTSWFTSGCWAKAGENNRIELIDGARLVALTREHLGKEVLISSPARKRGDRPASST